MIGFSLKKICKCFLSIVLVVTIFVFDFDVLFSQPAAMYKVDVGADTTDTYLKQSPGMPYQGRFLVLGDSYAYLFCKNCGQDFNYIVHRGYDVKKIFLELIPLIPDKQYDYCFFYIGPNDLMLQTTTPNFEYYVQEIINALKGKGITPILTSYVDLNYELFPEYADKIKGNMYDKVLAIMAKANYVPFIDTSRLVAKYGMMEDNVHPATAMYEVLGKQLVEYLNELIKTNR